MQIAIQFRDWPIQAITLLKKQSNTQNFQLQLKLCIHKCLHSPFGYLVGMLLACCSIAPAVRLFLAMSASPAAARQCANRLWLRPAPVPRWAPAAGCSSRLAARTYPACAGRLAPPRDATLSVRVRAAGPPPRRISRPGAGVSDPGQRDCSQA